MIYRNKTIITKRGKKKPKKKFLSLKFLTILLTSTEEKKKQINKTSGNSYVLFVVNFFCVSPLQSYTRMQFCIDIINTRIKTFRKMSVMQFQGINRCKEVYNEQSTCLRKNAHVIKF